MQIGISKYGRNKTRKLVKKYIAMWKARDYQDGIPDEVPNRIMDLCLAPSYKAIAISILKNDHSMQSLGFTPKKSSWYNCLKKMEIEERENLL